MKEKQTNEKGVTGIKTRQHFTLLLFLGLLFSSPLLAGVQVAAAPPSQDVEPCMLYAYASSGSHHFLALNDSYVYGEDLTIKSNCDYVRVSNDSGFMANSSKSTFDLPLLYGVHNLTFETNTHIQSIDNVTFIPSRFTWLDEYNLLTNQRAAGEWVLLDEVTSRENFAVFTSGVLTLFLIFAFYWRVIEHYLDHNRIEERRG